MKKRITIFIEEEVIGRAKRLAVKEGRSLSEVIRDAIVSHRYQKAPEPRKGEEAYRLFCERPMRLSKKQINKILEFDGNE